MPSHQDREQPMTKRNGSGLPNLDEHLLELARHGRLRYRTAIEVRAIPNEQWEQWLATEPPTVPFPSFAAIAEVQGCMSTIIAATKRRIEAQRRAR